MRTDLDFDVVIDRYRRRRRRRRLHDVDCWSYGRSLGQGAATRGGIAPRSRALDDHLPMRMTPRSTSGKAWLTKSRATHVLLSRLMNLEH